MDWQIILSLFMVGLVLTLVVWDIFIFSPQIQAQNESILSFCIENGFTDFKYSGNEYGFCYKEANGHLGKQGFFVAENNRILMMDE